VVAQVWASAQYQKGRGGAVSMQAAMPGDKKELVIYTAKHKHSLIATSDSEDETCSGRQRTLSATAPTLCSLPFDVRRLLAYTVFHSSGCIHNDVESCVSLKKAHRSFGLPENGCNVVEDMAMQMVQLKEAEKFGQLQHGTAVKFNWLQVLRDLRFCSVQRPINDQPYKIESLHIGRRVAVTLCHDVITLYDIRENKVKSTREVSDLLLNYQTPTRAWISPDDCTIALTVTMYPFLIFVNVEDWHLSWARHSNQVLSISYNNEVSGDGCNQILTGSLDRCLRCFTAQGAILWERRGVYMASWMRQANVLCVTPGNILGILELRKTRIMHPQECSTSGNLYKGSNAYVQLYEACFNQDDTWMQYCNSDGDMALTQKPIEGQPHVIGPALDGGFSDSGTKHVAVPSHQSCVQVRDLRGDDWILTNIVPREHVVQKNNFGCNEIIGAQFLSGSEHKLVVHTTFDWGIYEL
jgi:hypothetical protein